MKTKQILLVEDDPKVSAALTARLRSEGYGVLAAPGPSAGTSFALAEKPDLIITDFRMPAMNGLTFVRRLKEQGFADVPFMVITASYLNGIWEEAMALGAAAYFEKPYDPDRLMTAVHATLNSECKQPTKGPLS